jgi:hypothetical protein
MEAKELSKEYRQELLKFDHLSAMKLRKKYREKKCAGDKALHKKFCKHYAKKFEVNPRSVQWVATAKKWNELRPATHLHELPQGLGIVPERTKRDAIDPLMLMNATQTEIDIDKQTWRELNLDFSRGEIKHALADTIAEYKLAMPMQIITKKEAQRDYERLLRLDCSGFVKNVSTCTRWDYRYEISQYVIDAPRVGNMASNFYHQESRWNCDYKGIPSPARVWTEETHRLSVMNAFWSLKLDVINNAKIRAAIGIRKYIASQFKPACAKTFYELFNAKHVYDPSSGWGDRVCGFMASAGTKTYCSTDPNSRLYPGYAAEVKAYNQDNKPIEMYDHGSELKGGMRKKYGHKVDTVFTSPPYFNAEQYSKDEGQSFRQYGEIEAWLKGFLFPTVENAWDALDSKGKRGGILAMNIADIYNNDTRERGELCDPMNDHISKLKDARYIGCIGLRLAKRPESGALEGKKGVNIEPIWIWAKGGTWELEDYIKHGFKSSRR